MTENTKNTRGRPKQFKEEEILVRILDAFWARGYDALSTLSLVEITGVNKPSLYATFGSKEEIFEKVVNLYREKFKYEVALKSLNKDSFKDAIKSFFEQVIIFATSNKKAKGCLAIHGALRTNNDDKASKLLLQVRLDMEEVLNKRIRRAIKDGNYDCQFKPKYLAKYLATLHAGINIQILNDTPRKELEEVINIALTVIK